MSEYSTLSPSELLLAYRADGVSAHEDPENSLHLSIQGGAMAGIVGLGTLSVLESQGYLEHFKGIDAISAGVVNAASGMAGQIDKAFDFYLHAGEEHFINPQRFWQIVDLGKVERYMREVLDIEAIKAHPADLGIGLTDRRTQEPVAVCSRDIFEQDLDIVDYLRSATELPIAGGWTTRQYTDGGTSWPTTPDVSLHFGATHVLDISNHPGKTWKYRKWPSIPVDLWNTLSSGRINNLGKFCRFAYRQSGRITDGLPDNVETIYPAAGELPGTFDQDPDLLRKGYEAGQLAAIKVLKIENQRIFTLAA